MDSSSVRQTVNRRESGNEDRNRGRRGNVLLLFTLMLPALLLPIVGLAIDGTMLYIVQAKLSAAVDGAALGAGRLLGTAADPEEIAGEFLGANFPDGYWGSRNLVPIINVSRTLSSYRISVGATVEAPLMFARILGRQQTAVASSAVATRRESRIVLALDRSGSMTGQIASLRASAKDFTNRFVADVDQMGLVAYSTSAVVGYPPTRPYDPSATSLGGPNVNFQYSQSGGSMLDMIDAMAANGGTNMSEALSLAYTEIRKADNRDHDPIKLNAIVLFTDGIPTAMTATLNDPAHNSLKPKGNNASTQSKCTYNPGTAGTPSTLMTGALVSSGYPSNSLSNVYGIGPYRLGITYNTSPANTALYWMQHPYASQTDNNKLTPATPISSCTYLQAAAGSTDLKDLAKIPTLDYYGNSTDDGIVYKGSLPYNKYKTTYDPNSPTSGYHLGIASWNATDNAAKRILSDPSLNIRIYVIAYRGSDGVDSYLLKRVANAFDAVGHVPFWQTGLYVEASDAEGLQRAFETVAADILRLAE